jgi:hypothetical protein
MSSTSTASAISICSAGIAVNTLGHGHPALVEAVTKQASAAGACVELLHQRAAGRTRRDDLAARRRRRRVCGVLRQLRHRGDRGGDQAHPAHRTLTDHRRRGVLPRPLHRCPGAYLEGGLSRAVRAAHRSMSSTCPTTTRKPCGRRRRRRTIWPQSSSSPSRARAESSRRARHTCGLARELTTASWRVAHLRRDPVGMGRTGALVRLPGRGHRAGCDHPGQGAGRWGADRRPGHGSARGDGAAHRRPARQHLRRQPAGLCGRAWRRSHHRVRWRSARHAREMGEHLASAVLALGHPLIEQVRGRGAAARDRAAKEVSATVAARALEAGFLVNAVAPRQCGWLRRWSSRPTSSTPSWPHCQVCSTGSAPRRGLGVIPTTPTARRARIAALIGSQEVRSQGELLALLHDEGIEVTQATLSRDLVELGATKVRAAAARVCRPRRPALRRSSRRAGPVAAGAGGTARHR